MVNLRVSSGLQRREPHPDNEHGAAEAAEALLDTRGPEEQAADGKHGEADHEGDAEAVAAQDPAGDGQGAQEVGAKVGGGQAGGHGGGDVEEVLEVGVEGVEEAVGEAPEEEQDGHWEMWVSPPDLYWEEPVALLVVVDIVAM